MAREYELRQDMLGGRPVVLGPGSARVPLRINGACHELLVEPRVSLLDALREHLGLTGAKKGCNQGACGACTVLVDGQRHLSCLTLAVTCEGSRGLSFPNMRLQLRPSGR